MGFFVLIIVLITLFFEVFSILSLSDYYYSNTAGVLFSQARFNSELFLSYLSNDTLSNVVIRNKNQFYRTNRTQVQILDNAGRVLYDSIGSNEIGKILETPDVVVAQSNRSQVFIGNVDYDTDPVMSVSHPLNNQTRQVGIIRLTTSLREVNEVIRGRTSLFIGFGLLVIALSILFSWIVSRSITRPIKSLTKVAARLADGQFTVRAPVESSDEIGDLSKTLNFMSENILKKEQIKNEFISSVSHELRTPLTSIKGWAITLQADNVPEPMMNEGLKIIEKESDRLGAMVEDLLDFSRFSSGTFSLSKSTFDLVEVARNILSQFRPRTRDRKLDMIFNYAEEPMTIVADPDRIKQLLLNIIDNAIKFTPEGGTILTDLSYVDNNVKISVTDTGVGISEQEISLVTEKFWKGSSSASHTGLGLSICEEIAKAHGGTLTITSKVGKGTTVSCVIPKENVVEA